MDTPDAAPTFCCGFSQLGRIAKADTHTFRVNETAKCMEQQLQPDSAAAVHIGQNFVHLRILHCSFVYRSRRLYGCSLRVLRQGQAQVRNLDFG